jgi:hypothetical protein
MIKGCVNDGKVAHNRKEKHFSGAVKAVEKSSGRIIVDCRFYETDRTNYCCIWINDSVSGTHVRGSGRAGGYGYNREASAFHEAVLNCGVDVDEAQAQYQDRVLELICAELDIECWIVETRP